MTLPDSFRSGRRQWLTACSGGAGSGFLENGQRLSWTTNHVTTVALPFQRRGRTGLLPLCCLVACCLSLLSLAAGFDVKAVRDSQQRFRIEFPSESSSYHQVLTATEVSGPWAVVAVLPGTQGTLSWTGPDPLATGNAEAFFRVRRIPRDHPLDADKDGMDDLYELKWNFLDPVNASDARQDQDQDGLLNVGEYQLGTDPTAQDSDLDWVFDGYEVSKGTDPRNPASAPPLEFRINDNALYASNATVRLDFGPFVSETVALSEHPDMSQARVKTFSRRLDYAFADQQNGWRLLYVQFLRDNGRVASPVVSRGIHLDTVPPVLTIDTPANGLTTNVAVVRIEGGVSDATPVQVTVNGLRADGILQGRYMREDHALTSGPNPIVVVATDAAGNSTSLTAQCILDTSGDVTPPSLLLDLPLDYEVSGGVTNWYSRTTLGDEEVLRLHALTNERGVAASFTVTTLEATNGPYSGSVSGTDIWTRVLLFPGTNILRCDVSDAAGNQTRSNRMIIRDTNFFLRITSPGDLAVQNARSVTVSGIASPMFAKAAMTVNGVTATVADRGSNVSFTTTSPVPLNLGLTPLIAVAVLNGRTYQADPHVAGYEFLYWQHDYEHTYDCLEPDEDGYWVSEYQWIRDDTWDADTRQLVERPIHHLVDVYYWNTGATERNEDHYNVPHPSYREVPITSASFGSDDVRYQYVAYGRKAWDHDHLTIQDKVTFIKYGEKRETQLVVLQFRDLSYQGDPASPPVVDPTAVTFWGQRGFWHNGSVSFLVPIETFRRYTIIDSDFTWPIFRFRGPRPDMQSFYTSSDTVSTRHVIRFAGFENAAVGASISTIERVPVYGSDPDGTNEKSVQVAVVPSPLPGGLTLDLELTTIRGTGRATFANGASKVSLSQTTMVGIRGVENSSEKDNIELSAVAAGKALTRELLYVRTWPSELQQQGPGRDLGNGDLAFDYAILSESGSVQDIALNIFMQEHVEYVSTDGTENVSEHGQLYYRPKSPPFSGDSEDDVENPYVEAFVVNPNLGGLPDIHRLGWQPFRRPYRDYGFIAVQRYRFRDPWTMGPDQWNVLLGPIYIRRNVYLDAGVWWYRIEKSGSSALLRLP